VAASLGAKCRTSPSEAIVACERQDAALDLLITDVVMPEMSGASLRSRIEAIRPGIRVLFMSGYTSNVIGHHGILEDGVHFLQKPFSRDDLVERVREALGKA
jgi:two-component system, cell cycle sensor histidine kinase and response regulator CckA